MDDAQTPDARTPGAQSPSALIESVRWVRSDRLLLVWLRGAIDPVHADLLTAVRSDAARGDRVVLDLSEVSFFGATGTIIFSYFMELEQPISPDLAATMLFAIESDLAGAAGQPGELSTAETGHGLQFPGSGICSS